jgi:hypothetical protein
MSEACEHISPMEHVNHANLRSSQQFLQLSNSGSDPSYDELIKRLNVSFLLY